MREHLLRDAVSARGFPFLRLPECAFQFCYREVGVKRPVHHRRPSFPIFPRFFHHSFGGLAVRPLYSGVESGECFCLRSRCKESSAVDHQWFGSTGSAFSFQSSDKPPRSAAACPKIESVTYFSPFGCSDGFSYSLRPSAVGVVSFAICGRGISDEILACLLSLVYCPFQLFRPSRGEFLSHAPRDAFPRRSDDFVHQSLVCFFEGHSVPVYTLRPRVERVRIRPPVGFVEIPSRRLLFTLSGEDPDSDQCGKMVRTHVFEHLPRDELQDIRGDQCRIRTI